jgi:hypothetical protein
MDSKSWQLSGTEIKWNITKFSDLPFSKFFLRVFRFFSEISDRWRFFLISRFNDIEAIWFF